MKQAIKDARYAWKMVIDRRHALRSSGINATVAAMAATHGLVVTHVDRERGIIAIGPHAVSALRTLEPT